MVLEIPEERVETQRRMCVPYFQVVSLLGLWERWVIDK